MEDQHDSNIKRGKKKEKWRLHHNEYIQTVDNIERREKKLLNRASLISIYSAYRRDFKKEKEKKTNDDVSVRPVEKNMVMRYRCALLPFRDGRS